MLNDTEKLSLMYLAYELLEEENKAVIDDSNHILLINIKLSLDNIGLRRMVDNYHKALNGLSIPVIENGKLINGVN